MEKIGERIRIEDGAKSPLIRILPYYERWKQRLLITWLILWSFCGLFVASRLFVDVPAEEKVTYFVFLAFWAYFEYMALYAALWRSYGEERLWLEDGEMLLSRSIGKRERTYRYPLHELGELRLTDLKEGSFADHFDDSYYVIGRMRLEMEYGDKMVRFGEKLSEQDARDLKKRLKHRFFPSQQEDRV